MKIKPPTIRPQYKAPHVGEQKPAYLQVGRTHHGNHSCDAWLFSNDKRDFIHASIKKHLHSLFLFFL